MFAFSSGKTTKGSHAYSPLASHRDGDEAGDGDAHDAAGRDYGGGEEEEGGVGLGRTPASNIRAVRPPDSAYELLLSEPNAEQLREYLQGRWDCRLEYSTLTKSIIGLGRTFLGWLGLGDQSTMYSRASWMPRHLASSSKSISGGQ